MQRTADIFAAGHYSPATAKNYLTELRYLFSHYADCRPSELIYKHTVDYLIYITKTLGCSQIKSKMAAQSFSFFFKHVLQTPYLVPGFLFPARDAKIPVCMSVQEVVTIINAVDNVKHKMVLSLLYITGLRLKEVVSLKIEDVNSKAMCIKVIEGKGKKDRFVALSDNILTSLRTYYLKYKSLVYLLNSEKKGSPYSCRSVQQILEKVLHKRGYNTGATAYIPCGTVMPRICWKMV